MRVRHRLGIALCADFSDAPQHFDFLGHFDIAQRVHGGRPIAQMRHGVALGEQFRRSQIDRHGLVIRMRKFPSVIAPHLGPGSIGLVGEVQPQPQFGIRARSKPMKHVGK